MAKKQYYKILIGRAEFVSFPELFIDFVPAKVDTGAYRSAVHASNIKLTTKSGKSVLSFDLLGGHPCSSYSRHIETKNFEETVIENSFGVSEERFTVMLKIKIGPRTVTTDFTLADRSMKPYPILLGRTLTSNRFIVDTAVSGVDRALLKKKMNIDLPLDLEDK